MKIRVIDSIQELLKMQNSWNDLLSKSPATSPFSTLEWLSNWWTSYGEGKKLFVLVAQEDEDASPVGIAPLMITKSAGFRVVEFIGTGLSDYLNFIAAEEREETIKVFFEYLNERKKDWDMVWLRDVPSDAATFGLFPQAAADIGWRILSQQTTISPYLSIRSEWTQFLSTKNSHFRRNIRQKEKRLDREGLKFEVRMMTSPVDRATFEQMVEIERGSWKWAEMPTEAQRRRKLGFYFDFFRSFAKKGWLNLWIGYLHDRPAAYLINFDFMEKIWFYNSAFDKKYWSYSLGAVLLNRALEDAFSRGKREYDFMRGEEVFKSRWTSGKRDIHQFIFIRKALRSVFACFLLFRVRWNVARFVKYFKGWRKKRGEG